MQGLNTTPLHGHTALFGVYGMLGIALMLFCLRGLRGQMDWDVRPLKLAFWGLNIGLAMMVAPVVTKLLAVRDPELVVSKPRVLVPVSVLFFSVPENVASRAGVAVPFRVRTELATPPR